MLEQISNSLTFLAFYTASGVGKTGLTVTIDVYRGVTEVVTAGGATEIGDGLYYYTLSSGSVTSEALYTAVFKTSDTTVDQKHLPALWAVGTAGVENLNDPIGDKLDASAYTAPLGAAATAAAVLDAVATDYNDAGSIGAKINAAGAAADPLENDPTTYAAGTVGAKIAQIGTVGATIPSPANPSGELTLNQGVSYTTYSSLVYNCRLVGGFDENTHPVKLFVDYADGTVLIKTVATTSIATTASYITVDLAPALTSVVTRNMPIGSFKAQIVLFNGSGNSEANIIYELTLNVETPGFNYSASDT